MANITVFDPVTTASKTISITVESSIIQQDGDANVDYFIRFTTTAKNGAGTAIVPLSLRGKSDLVGGAYQHDGVTSTPYATMSDAIDDYVLRMVEGTDEDSAMSFT